MKEIFEKLIFKCPSCNYRRNYESVMKHMQTCNKGGGGASVQPMKQQLTPAQGGVEQVEVIDINEVSPLKIFIMEKDSKKFYLYDSGAQSVSTNIIDCNFNFPHNFQAV